VFSTNHSILKHIPYEHFLSNAPVQKVRFLPQLKLSNGKKIRWQSMQHIRQTLIKEIKILFGEPEDRRLTFLGLNQRSVLKEIFKKRLSCEDVFG